MAALRVGFLARSDPENPRSWSGTYRSMLTSLREQDVEVVVLPWRAAPPTRALRLERRLRPAGKPGHAWWEAGAHGLAVDAALRNTPVDVVLAVAASTQSARLASSVPLVTATDATFASLVDLYPTFRGLSAAAVRQGRRIDRTTVQRSARVVYPSQWAARASVRDCGADPARVVVLPYGPNLAPPAAPPTRQPGARPTVLFVGVDWERKGGDVALAAVRQLNDAGRGVRLLCVGSGPPEPDPEVEVVRFDKSTAEGAAGLAAAYGQADVMVLPSRADCSPIVLCEAAAFGLPAVVSDVGGIPEIVSEGRTGRVLPVEAPTSSWAEALDQVLRGPEHARMSAAAREAFEDELNWRHWAEQMHGVLHAAASTGLTTARKA